MTATSADLEYRSGTIDGQVRRTARAAGWLYLCFFVVGIAGTYLVRSRLFVDGDPAATLSHVTAREALARTEVALELAIATVQALTALWLYRLFRPVDGFVAGSLVLLGMVNATAILTSSAVLATALNAAQDTALSAAGAAAATVQLLYVLSGNLWGVAAVFFGLWLVPMGWLVLRSRWLPALLGRLLVVAGAGYVLSAFLTYLAPNADLAVQLLQLPSVVGELWMAGYLLLIGVRDRPAGEDHPAARQEPVSSADAR